MFQNCVILDSNKTGYTVSFDSATFQNCVILDSNKTATLVIAPATMFQNCAILDSNKALTVALLASSLAILMRKLKEPELFSDSTRFLPSTKLLFCVGIFSIISLEIS